MAQHTFDKYYYAVVKGTLKEPKGTFTDYIVKDGRTNTSRVCEPTCAGAKKAVLEYEVLECKVLESKASETEVSDAAPLTHISLVKIHLITGRHHQIRVQFASRGLALLGDTKYGGKDNSGSRISLQAYAIDIDGRHLEIPCEFNQFTQ
jgi:23S rRNA pseudouridine1911/1915/1917 synthase